MSALIEISVNGEPQQVPASATVSALLTQFGLDPLRVAIEVNAQLVRRANFAQTALRPADRIEIVTLVGGG